MRCGQAFTPHHDDRTDLRMVEGQGKLSCSTSGGSDFRYAGNDMPRDAECRLLECGKLPQMAETVAIIVYH